MTSPMRDALQALDLRLFRLLNQDGGPALDHVMQLVTTRTFGLVFGLLMAGLLVIALRREAARVLLALGVALLMSDFLAWHLLRPLWPRHRPCYVLPPGSVRWLAPAADVPSLPSLHASNMFALAWVVAWARPRLAPLAFAAAVLVAASRVYVGVHWPADVVAGALWGSVAGATGWAVARAVRPRAS